MLQQAITISLQITALHVLFSEGNLLAGIRIAVANKLDKLFSKRTSKYLQKPLWGCLACMASVWTIVLTQTINLPLMLLVCGINSIIYHLIFFNHEAKA